MDPAGLVTSGILRSIFVVFLGCDIGGAKELGVIYFPTNWGAKEPQNLPNHRVVFLIGKNGKKPGRSLVLAWKGAS